MVINRSHNQCRVPPLYNLSSNGFDSIEIAKCAIFSTNCSISFDTRARFLRGHCATGKRTRKEMNKFNFCYHSLVWIWGKTLGITSLTITLNMRTVNVNHRSESVFDKSRCKRYRKCRATNIPSGRNKKKPAGKRRMETVNLTTANNYVRSLWRALD